MGGVHSSGPTQPESACASAWRVSCMCACVCMRVWCVSGVVGRSQPCCVLGIEGCRNGRRMAGEEDGRRKVVGGHV